MMRITFLYSCVLVSTLFSALEAPLQSKIDLIDTQNKALFVEVKEFTDRLLEEERANLKYDDIDASVGSLRQALEHAYAQAELNGMSVERLKALYELAKKVILRADFLSDKSKTAPSALNTFEAWFDFVGVTHEGLQKEKQKAQEMRLAYMKKTTIQFIEVLNQKDATAAYEHFKRYVDALRTLQSADADQLIAQADALVAEQKLVADVASGLPFVGDAMDIVALVSGEDLSGQQLGNLEKGITLLALLTPEVVTQTLKRNPSVAQHLAKMVETLSALPATVKEKVPSEALQKILAKTPSPEIVKWREFYAQKVKEAQQLKRMDPAERLAKAEAVEKELGDLYTRKAPLSDEMGGKIGSVAKARDEIILTRPVNDSMETLVKSGAYTKGMYVKGKSAEAGIAKGFIPRNQGFSKLSDPEKIAKFQREVDGSLQTTVFKIDGVEVVKPQTAGSKQLVVKQGEESLSGVEIAQKGSDKTVAVYKKSDGTLVDEQFNPLSSDVLKTLDLKSERPFEILTDMDGNYLTADIDLLAVGSKKQETILQNDVLMGNINANEMATVGEVNRALKDDAYKNRQLVHHGGENNFMSQASKPDFPTTAYLPDGKVAVIQNEAELKQFFHAQKLKGYNLQPNPYWGWGEYDPIKGYAHAK